MVCVYMCVYARDLHVCTLMCMYTLTDPCGCMWRSEINIRMFLNCLLASFTWLLFYFGSGPFTGSETHCFN